MKSVMTISYITDDRFKTLDISKQSTTCTCDELLLCSPAQIESDLQRRVDCISKAVITFGDIIFLCQTEVMLQRSSDTTESVMMIAVPTSTT